MIPAPHTKHFLQATDIGLDDLQTLEEAYNLMVSAYNKLISNKNRGFRNTLISSRFVDTVRRLQGDFNWTQIISLDQLCRKLIFPRVRGLATLRAATDQF
jgi:hypothetical protein